MRSEAIGQDGRRVADIFAEYEKQLRQSNALDFDDLLLRSAKLLRESAGVREKWQARFQYIHVDEYQDTNRVQYELLRLLTGPKQNVCVVGDEDQSIYRWRGADRGHPDELFARLPCRTGGEAGTELPLDTKHSGRSGRGGGAQSGPIGQDAKRRKTAAATNLKYFEARDAQGEAEFVAGELERILGDDSSQTCAVEYRTNFQSRAFEEVFRRRGIRYKLVGGFEAFTTARK